MGPKTTGSYRVALWLVLLVLVGQALGIRPEHLAARFNAKEFPTTVAAITSAPQNAGLAEVISADAGVRFDLAVAVIECTEWEEDEVHCATSKEKRGPDTRSAELLAGIAARYAASLPWKQAREVRIPRASRHVLLGVFRV